MTRQINSTMWQLQCWVTGRSANRPRECKGPKEKRMKKLLNEWLTFKLVQKLRRAKKTHDWPTFSSVKMPSLPSCYWKAQRLKRGKRNPAEVCRSHLRKAKLNNISNDPFPHPAGTSWANLALEETRWGFPTLRLLSANASTNPPCPKIVDHFCLKK